MGPIGGTILTNAASSSDMYPYLDSNLVQFSRPLNLEVHFSLNTQLNGTDRAGASV